MYSFISTISADYSIGLQSRFVIYQDDGSYQFYVNLGNENAYCTSAVGAIGDSAACALRECSLVTLVAYIVWIILSNELDPNTV